MTENTVETETSHVYAKEAQCHCICSCWFHECINNKYEAVLIKQLIQDCSALLACHCRLLCDIYVQVLS